MARLRFVPMNDTLEPRVMLSSTAIQPAAVHVSSTSSTVQLSSYQQRLQRIDRLPYFLNTVHPGRPLPANVITQMQNDLRSVIGRLGTANSEGLYSFNRELRNILGSTSVSRANFQPILQLLSANLKTTGMPTATVDSLTAGVKQLAQATIDHVPNPTSAVANDASLLLQLSLAMGKPLPAPVVPRLVPADQIKGHNNITHNPQPTLTGTFEAGMTMKVYNEAGTILLGSAPTDAKGHYQVKLTTPLQQGRNFLRVVAVGPGGISSLQSRRFNIGLQVAPPK